MQRSTSNALPARVRNLGRERAPQHGRPGRTRGVELGARESLELGQLPEGHLREVVVLAVVVRGDAQHVEPGFPIHAVRRPVARRAADASTLIIHTMVRHEEGRCREGWHLPNGLRYQKKE